VVKAGLAHLWFVTIHPFEDGNGRMARAVGDMALARAEKSAQRYYSLSAQIQRERNDYYDRAKPPRRGAWMSPIGWHGFWPACFGLFKAPRKRWPP
jgi:Fic family protein